MPSPGRIECGAQFRLCPFGELTTNISHQDGGELPSAGCLFQNLSPIGFPHGLAMKPTNPIDPGMVGSRRDSLPILDYCCGKILIPQAAH